MARSIENKIVVITGAAEGIGFEIANKFLQHGASRIIILDINETQGKKAVETLTQKYGDKIDYIKCDVTKNLEAVSNDIFDRYKTVDVLVNNAGIIDELDVKKTIGINLIALIEWSFKFIEHMRIDKGGKGGTIINLSSIHGFRGDLFVPVYKASKHGVMGFTKTIGHEFHFKRTGVRIVAICPGFTKTSIMSNHVLSEVEIQELDRFMSSPEAIIQDVDAVGKAAIDVFETAESGSAWLIEGGKPIERVF